jgi:hypothetical protein
MTLEESHCEASKWANKCFVHGSYLCVEGLRTFEESFYQAAKISNRGSVNTMDGGTDAP